MLKVIVCADINGGIGYKNNLLFRIKEDLQFFKQMTSGHKIVMGYNTWKSLPKKLPNRDHYILTSRNDIMESTDVHIIRSVEDIIEMSKYDDVFVIGGGQLYREIISKNLADELYLTLVNAVAENADTRIDLFDIGRTLHHRAFMTSISDGLVNIYKYYRY